MLRFLQLSALRTAPTLLLAALLALGLAALPARAAEDIRFGHGLLWQVQKDGGPVNYVLGTIHSTDPRLRDLPPEVDRAIDDSSLLAFELLDSAEGQALMAQAMRLPPGRQLEDILGADLFQRTADAVSGLGVPAEALQGFKPWALSLFLIYPRIEVVRLAQGEPAFDSWLQAEARRRGKTVEALETYAEQIDVFDAMSEAEQVAMVTDMLADHAEIEAQFNRIFRAYLKRDLTVAMAEANDLSGVSDVAAAERFKQRLIDDRNRTMAERIKPLLQAGGAFVAVGAAHLPGDGGVLDLLEAQGYSLTRVY